MSNESIITYLDLLIKESEEIVDDCIEQINKYSNIHSENSFTMLRTYNEKLNKELIILRFLRQKKIEIIM